MGCDIHATIEKKVKDHWVMVNRLNWQSNKNAMMRNYSRFAALAGVRGDGPQPLGIPADISESTKLYIDEWDSDGHSHSYLDLIKATVIFLKTAGQTKPPDEFMNKYPVSYFFDIEDDILPGQYRLIFWFDN